MTGPRHWLRLARRCAVGLAADFWKDGGKATVTPDAGDGSLWTPKARGAIDRQIAAAVAAFAPDAHLRVRNADGCWQARAGEVEAALTSASDALRFKLCAPCAITVRSRVLCLGAGAGELALWLARAKGCRALALTADAALAVRTQALSAADNLTDRAAMLAIEPDELRRWLKPAAAFDLVIGHDPGGAMFDRAAFLARLTPCLDRGARFSLTDFVTADDTGLTRAVASWREAGLDVQAHEDISDLYKRQVMAGLAGFVKSMATMKANGILPDPATRQAIGAAIAARAEQVAALDRDLRLYHFQAALLQP